MSAKVIPFDPKERKQRRRSTLPPLEDVFICSEVELRPGTLIEIDGLPLNLTIGELNAISEAIFYSIANYGERHGYV